MNDKEIIWDRLKNGVKPKPVYNMDKVLAAFGAIRQATGKSTMAMQALGRAMRDVNEKR